MDKKTKYEGKWLSFHEVSFTNSRGEPRIWEYAARTGTVGAAAIIAIEEGEIPKLIVVKQFRPAIDNFSLEFPAGLVDPGESIQAAALRELEEETGYIGQVTHESAPVYSSPGLTDEQVSLVTVKIIGKTETKLESDESIEVITLPINNLMDELIRIQDTGPVIDAKLWTFAQGLRLKIQAQAGR
ncbi:MAG: NUDIX hydrolase [Verrucomicrobia bacterium]|nr:NUDIX hydrolase [Verrucomicrobiota bacterium]MDA1067578.1 NUDIX hydrolase [Verrucomicrobiota bacterium]